MKTTTTILGFDIKGVSNPILMTEILIETPSDRKEMTVPIDMDYMGFDEDTDFDMELSKDIIREVEIYYKESERIPTARELKRLVKQYDYGCHPAPDSETERYFLQCEIDEVTADCNIGF
jgi:hypothetical protein